MILDTRLNNPDIQTKDLNHQCFELSDVEEANLSEWKKKIKDLYGEYGYFTYSFSPTGIANSIKVYSHLAKIEQDITDLDNW